MKKAVLGVVMLAVGYAGFMVLPAEEPLRYISLGLAVTGVLMILVTTIEWGGK